MVGRFGGAARCRRNPSASILHRIHSGGTLQMGFPLWQHWVNGRAIARPPRSRRRTQLRLEVLEDRTLLSAALGVTFDEGGGPLPELAALSYSWGATNPPAAGAVGGGAGRAN